MAFAGSGHNSRAYQFFIAVSDRTRLGHDPWETPFAQVTEDTGECSGSGTRVRANSNSIDANSLSYLDSCCVHFVFKLAFFASSTTATATHRRSRRFSRRGTRTSEPTSPRSGGESGKRQLQTASCLPALVGGVSSVSAGYAHMHPACIRGRTCIDANAHMHAARLHPQVPRMESRDPSHA